jgi:hypothetical protein
MKSVWLQPTIGKLNLKQKQRQVGISGIMVGTLFRRENGSLHRIVIIHECHCTKAHPVVGV